MPPPSVVISLTAHRPPRPTSVRTAIQDAPPPRRSPASVTVSGGSMRTTRSAVRLTSSPRLQRAFDHGSRVDRQFERAHHADAANASTMACFCREASSAASKTAPTSRTWPMMPPPRDTARPRSARQLLEHVQRGAGGEQVAAVGGAVIAGEDLCRPRARQTSAAPTGTPDPSALPTEIRSGCHPNA